MKARRPLSANESRKQELSCTNVLVILQYMEAECGAEQTRQAVEAIGLPTSFLKSKSNWVSYEYYNRLLDTLVELTGDEKAPLKAPLSTKPQEVFEYALYATQALLWYGGLKLPYRLILGSDFYRRWTKIGRFEVVSATSRSMVVEMTLDSGFRQTRNNCYAVQGMLAAIPAGIGLPPAEVTESHCAVDGHRGCTYEVKWKNPRRGIASLALPVFAVIAILQRTVFSSYFAVRDIFLTGLGIAVLALLVKNYQFRRSLREQERLNQQRNEYLVDNLKKVEDDYGELLEVKTALLERTDYLTIVGKVGESVSRETSLNGLLGNICGILTEKLEMDRGEFFKLDPHGSHFSTTIGDYHRVPSDQFYGLQPAKHRFRIGDLESGGATAIASWIPGSSPEDILLILPLLVPDTLTGFFCFYTPSLRVLSEELIDSLFIGIADQLKVGFAKISSMSTIDDILSSIPESVLIFNSDNYRVRYVNTHFHDSFQEIGRGEKTEIIGNSLFSVLELSSDVELNIKRGLERLGTGESTEVFETTVGSAVLEYSVFSISRSAEGEKLAGIILNDVSEQKSFQQKMLTSEKLLALGRVAGGIAHEINNPLYAVLANAEDIAEDEHASADTRTYAREIIDHVMSISAVIKDLSTYSKTMRKESKDPADLNEILEESLKLVQYGSDFMEIEIQKRIEPVPEVRIIRGEVQQIFINLINNAIWAMGGKGTLSISTESKDGCVEVSIGDTGIGIPEENLPHIFNYLFTTKAPGEGTGQGLSIVKRLADRNRGTIRVESRPNEGTTFLLSFPVTNGNCG